MLQLQAFILSANQPLKHLASFLSRDTQSTSQTQMKHSRKTSLCHLEQASIQDPMHKGCPAISQYSSIVLSVVKLALIAAFAMKPLPIPIRLCAGSPCTRIYVFNRCRHDLQNLLQMGVKGASLMRRIRSILTPFLLLS
jgi:hypothetical protein